MRTNKRLLVLGALSALLSLVAAACGSDSNPTPTPTTGGGGGQATPTAGSGFDAEAYFRGRTIQFVTSSNPGGGTDTQLRHLATGISRFLPGNPQVRVSNNPPHVAGINFIWNAEPDGFTLGYISHDPLREESFDEAEYNTAEFTFIADVGVDVNVLLVKTDLGYETIEDIMGSDGPELVMAAQAPNPLDIENAVLGWMLMAEWLDLPLRINAVAETGTNIQILDMERGNQNTNEFGGGAWFLIGVSQRQWFENDEYRIMLNRGMTQPTPPNAAITANTKNWPPPHLYDFISDEQQSMWEGMVLATENLDRPVIAPPGMDPNIRDALRKAFETAFTDSQYCQEWEQITGAPCAWNDPEQLAPRVARAQQAIAQWADQADSMKEQLFPKYFRN